LTGAGGQPWIEALQQVGDEFGVSTNGVVIAHSTSTMDVYGRWAELREMEDDGCILVRPDRFIAYRANEQVADPVGTLRRIFAQILGRQSRDASATTSNAAAQAFVERE
jgi:2,4-dichlorophenol 6-monooxygenase